jgi:hypothetical protein
MLEGYPVGWEFLVLVGCLALFVVALMNTWRKRKRKQGDGRGNGFGEASLGGPSHRNIDHNAGSDSSGSD